MLSVNGGVTVADIFYNYWCEDCEHEVDRASDYETVCSRCGSHNILKRKYIICPECGDEVNLSSNTNECWECGTLYNAFGQELANPNEWSDEDFYDYFGPQSEVDECKELYLFDEFNI